MRVAGSWPSWPIASKMNWKRFWSLAWSAVKRSVHVPRMHAFCGRTAEGLPLASSARVAGKLCGNESHVQYEINKTDLQCGRTGDGIHP